MSCLHATSCPLFPYLRSSLQGWRDYYCDSEHEWRGCARYRTSLAGEGVPITLLPNGKTASYIDFTGTDEAPSDPSTPTTPTTHTTSVQQSSDAGGRPGSRESGPEGGWNRFVRWMRGSA
ncbi:hypothetical protein [Streptomyces europaeiscabiei]|uniref:hypothetical protein n=1 Tax=Streptomyces europaeiscabiei TaxID=146819 RepID=UPI0029B2B7EC|nr:hypothetical protein [Streptomyces europaeiscabiei]MDX3668073.1 hypothetical protein [Streptomyces europaeiscabiei]MDX3709091.1 hypothetical protein [Streptomyces europaeiscabiei]MDX3777473.1 hypothetical protein [Streptomyces europaeiscabiei]